jgi:tRNA threonylcarbamoyladenosine biosynthesis protein TsaE
MTGILGTRQLHWPDEAGCAASAVRLAGCAALHDAFVTLEGPLGAGKTTFVRHLLRALGVVGRIKSPTYTVLEPHEAGALRIAHLDFYRFSDPREWEDAGLRDVFAQPGLKLAEWPERVQGWLPPPDLRLRIAPVSEERSEPSGEGFGDDAREVLAQALTPRGLDLLQAWAPASASKEPDAS